MIHEEYQYLELIERILKTGSLETTRNGTTKSVFGNMMRFTLRDGTLPLLTTKQVAWKTCFKELMWFVSGNTNNYELNKQDVHIWDANCTRTFLDSRGLTDYESDDELGPIYGWQWRQFNKPYYSKTEKAYQQAIASSVIDEDMNLQPLTNNNDGIDQLQQIIDALKDPNQRTSRRLIMSAWNPCQLGQMALPPCHILCQFNVRDGKYLSCALYQRSGDVGLGVPFNIASYSFLTHILAKHCGLEADEFVYFLGNAHIYESHIEPLKTQLERVPYEFPKLEIKQTHLDIENYTLDDIEWPSKYVYHPSIKMEMVA
jgi:thymidylate synthase